MKRNDIFGRFSPMNRYPRVYAHSTVFVCLNHNLMGIFPEHRVGKRYAYTPDAGRGRGMIVKPHSPVTAGFHPTIMGSQDTIAGRGLTTKRLCLATKMYNSEIGRLLQ